MKYISYHSTESPPLFTKSIKPRKRNTKCIVDTLSIGTYSQLPNKLQTLP